MVGADWGRNDFALKRDTELCRLRLVVFSFATLLFGFPRLLGDVALGAFRLGAELAPFFNAGCLENVRIVSGPWRLKPSLTARGVEVSIFGGPARSRWSLARRGLKTLVV